MKSFKQYFFEAINGPKSDIDLRTVGSSNATVSADFTLIIVDNA